jgi:fumarate hydratase class II
MYNPKKTMNSNSNLSFSESDVDAKAMKIPSYSDIRPHLIQPVKDLIKVINATCPKIGPNGVSLGCSR